MAVIDYFVNFPLPVLATLAVLLVITALYYYTRMSSSGGQARHSAIDEYVRDLTHAAEEDKLDPVIGREAEIQHIIRILARRTKNNPILVGESGVGKTAIVEGLATEIINGNVPSELREKRVLNLDLAGMLAGTKYRGEFEQRLKKILNQIVAAHRNIIVFIDEIQQLAEAGEAEGAIGAADILKPALARGELQVIGATTIQEYEAIFKKDATLERRFQPIIVNEPNPEQTRRILHGLRGKYEQYHDLAISDAAIDEAVSLADLHLKNRHFPDKAIDLIDEAAAMVHLWAVNAKKPIGKEHLTVTPENIREVLSAWIQEDVKGAEQLSQKLQAKQDQRAKYEPA